MRRWQTAPHLSGRDQRAIIRLWNELAEFPAFSSQEALHHCVRTLSAHTGAMNMIWVGAARLKGWEQQVPNDQLLGWRPRASVYLYPTEARLRGNALRWRWCERIVPIRTRLR